jgi:hypothetical protein
MKILRNALFLIAFCSIFIAGVTAYAANTQRVDKQFMKEELSELVSYTNETTYLLTLYQANKVTSPYYKIQAQYLNKKTISLYDQLLTTTIPTILLPDVEQTERIALKLSQELSLISNMAEDDKQDEKHIQAAQEIKKELLPIQKQYE